MNDIEDVFPNLQIYLHENGELITKRHGGVVQEPGGFVRHVWGRNALLTPEAYLAMLVEARDLGALPSSLRAFVDANRLTRFIPDALARLGIEPREVTT